MNSFLSMDPSKENIFNNGDPAITDKLIQRWEVILWSSQKYGLAPLENSAVEHLFHIRRVIKLPNYLSCIETQDFIELENYFFPLHLFHKIRPEERNHAIIFFTHDKILKIKNQLTNTDFYYTFDKRVKKFILYNMKQFS